MRKQITLKNEHYTECPECKGELKYQDSWSELFDRYDRNTPSMDLVIRRIYQDGEPKYICKECKLQILVN